jgi:hypothetical protein
MLDLKSQIRAHRETKTGANVQLEQHASNKAQAKRNQILVAALAKKSGVGSEERQQAKAKSNV